MTADVELLPLPGSVADWLRRFGAANGSIQSEVIEGWFHYYARANVAHAAAVINDGFRYRQAGRCAWWPASPDPVSTAAWLN